MPYPTINSITHADGVPWWQADIPAERHRCQPQTSEWQGVTRRERCACGAIRLDGGAWTNRNARRAE